MSEQSPAGWYPDPSDESAQRWWDGQRWTAVTRPAGTTGPDPDPAPAQPAREPVQAPRPASPWAPPADDARRPATRPSPPAGPGRRTPDGALLASPWRRLLARILDGLLVGLVTLALGWRFVSELTAAMNRVLGPASGRTTPDLTALLTDGGYLHALAGLTWINLGVSLVYFFAFTYGLQATPGKLALGIRVRSVTGAHPTAWQCLGRTLGLELLSAVPTIGTLYAIVAVLWILWDPQRQGLHDKIARTVVVRRV